MKNKLFIRIFAGIIIQSLNTVFAQQSYPMSKHLMKEDSAAINALAVYPSTIRTDIYEACDYPAAIVNISTLQKNTSSEFSELVKDYSKEEQEDFWNMSKYPDLISSLVKDGRKSPDEITAILANYPKDINQTAIKVEKEHYQILQKMDAIQTSSNKHFSDVIADYPHGTQDALKTLIQYPEIINLLNDHLSMTVRVGDYYRRDPQGLINWMDEINAVEAKQNAEDAAKWKKYVEENPDASDELKIASKDFARENGYSEDEMNVAPESEYINNYTCAPYSYWFGYPTWYPYSYWYPYPFWFDVGFYFNPFGAMILLGPPSFFFTNWFFYYPGHYHFYPHLGEAYVNHYYGRRSFSSNGRVVDNWVHENRNYLPKDFATNRTNRTEVIRQVGQMNVEAQKQEGGRRPSSAARNSYFEKNATRYPALNTREQSKAAEQGQQQGRAENLPTPERQPHVNINKSEQQPNAKPRNNFSERFNNMNRAQEYHRNRWEQFQPFSRPQSSPMPRSAPQMRSAPSLRMPSGGGRRR